MLNQTTFEGVAFSTPTGGQIAIPPGSEVTVPGPIRQLSSGVTFGPLAVMPKTTEPVGIKRLAFPKWRRAKAANINDCCEMGAVATGSVAVASVTGPSDSSQDGMPRNNSGVSRRGFLAGAGLVFGGAALEADPSYARNQYYPHLELELSENSGGVTLDLVEATASSGEMAPSHDVHLDGTRIGRLRVGAGEGVLIPADHTGHVTVQSRSIDGGD